MTSEKQKTRKLTGSTEFGSAVNATAHQRSPRARPQATATVPLPARTVLAVLPLTSRFIFLCILRLLSV